MLNAAGPGDDLNFMKPLFYQCPRCTAFRSILFSLIPDFFFFLWSCYIVHTFIGSLKFWGVAS